MGDLTQGAIEALLSALKTAIDDETRLMGGVHSDMKFIKDEMDSMNGFLLHLNKMEMEHDDQVRAWMKQVREVSYVAEDCIDRYVRDIGRHGVRLGDGWCKALNLIAMAGLFLKDRKAYRKIHNLGKQIAELKARVRDVGERRQRYDVSVPDGRDLRKVDSKQLPGPVQEEEERKRREAFVRALELELKEARAPLPLGSSFFLILRRKMGALLQDALAVVVPSAAAVELGLGLGGLGGNIRQLPNLLVPSEVATIRGILKKCSPPEDYPAGGGGGAAEADEGDQAAAFRCMKKMFLCALYVYPYPTNQELRNLDKRVNAPGVAAKEARDKVMVFCYSLLSTQQKSCLQYLTAFLDEKEISRTSMVRRWVAEGLVGKDLLPRGGGGGGGAGRTMIPEEAGERCFRELLLRGFICPARWSDAGTVKSCVMDAPAREFIVGITKVDNFVVDLPDHLDLQLKIRRIVSRPSASMPAPLLPPPQPKKKTTTTTLLVRRHCCLLGGDHGALEEDEDDATKDPMDELVDLLKKLPQLYRLNVLDLGGCTGLRTHHLESFAEVDCLKYLSLRNADVSRLHADHINKLKLLETLDIRDTHIPPRDTKKINLPKLKHLLAGRFIKTTTMTTTTTVEKEKASLVTVHMPDRIGSMKDMETLSHVEVSKDGAELRGVAKLHQLRKLGVVVHANATTAGLLGRVLYLLAGNLRSLSIWVVAIATTTTQQGGDGGILDVSSMHEMASNLALENLHIKGKISLPSWIGRAPKLANVTLRDTEMDGGDALRRLATVQSLRFLKISRKAFTKQALRFKDVVQFQALRVLVVEGDALTRITFLAKDAAPKLEKIVWVIGGGSKIIMYNEDFIIGIDHLTSLKEIELRACFKLTALSDWTKQQQQQATSGNSTYRIRYISLSDGQLITELPRIINTHTTLSLPAGVIN